MKKQLNGLTQKVLSILLAAMMVWTQTGLNVFADNQSPEDVWRDAQSSDNRNQEINPEINIQHYLNFDAVSMGLITTDANIDGIGTVTYPLRNAPDWDTSFSWADFKANWQTWPANEKATATGILLKIYNKEARGTIENGSGKPEYGLVLDTDGNMMTHRAMKMLFEDETAEFLNKPQLKYMNRLTNNENYALKQLWVASNLKDPSSVNPDDFKIVDITSDLDAENPIIFTNDPDYSEMVGEKEVKANPAEPTRINNHLVVVVSEGMTIRFMFDPTSETYYKDDVNFFDYDISDGYIYVDGTQMATSQQEAQQDLGKTTEAHTGKQGINSDSNYSGSGAKLAFGNVNTGTGLGNQTWFSGNGKDNAINQYNKTNSLGSVFGLVEGLNEDGTLDWAEGIDAPALFSTNDPEEDGITGKTNYINKYGLQFNRVGGTYVLNGVTEGTGENRSVIESASSLSTFKPLLCPSSDNLTRTIYSNQFWPMDAAPSYGADGHDLKFGTSTDPGNYGTPTDPLTQKKNSFTGIETPEGELKTGGKINKGPATSFLPKADDAENHNSYFGMSFTTDFYLDPGYAGPLRYYFYGDDDMFVFLSRVTTTTNADGTTTETVSDPQLVADVGGVHSSVGMYVNLWPYVNNGQGPISYPSNTMSDEDKAAQIQHYRLSVFYTERGASGSTCFMRLTVPFEPNDPGQMVFNADLNVEKEVKAQTGDAEALEKEYNFCLNLKNGGTVTVTNDDGETVTRPATYDESTSFLVNRYEYTITNKDGTEASTGMISNGGTFTLKDGQRFSVKNLPQGSLYRVQEIKLDSGESTTFVSGKIDVDGETHIHKDFQAGTIVEGSTQEENYIKYVNAADLGALTLNKSVVDQTTTKDFEFEVSLEAPDNAVINSLSVLRNGLQNEDIQPNAEGKFEVVLHWNKDKYDTVTLYDIPLKSKYTVTEITDGNYLPSDITVTGGTENKTTLTTGTAEGIIDADGPITDSNRPLVTVNYTNIYAPNAMAQINVNKTIDGRNAANGGEGFTFKLEGDNDLAKAYLDGQSLFAELTVPEGENKNEKPTAFAPMYFTKEQVGTYVFKVTEMGGGSLQNGLKYDNSVYQVTVEAAIDPETGDMTATTSWTKGNQASGADNGDTLEFINKTELAADAEIGFAKNIQGEGIQDDEYEFKMEAITADAPMPANDTVTIKNDGKETQYDGKFGPIPFTRDNLGASDKAKTYEYKITESKSDTEGLITDDTVYTATIEVSKTTNDQGISSLEAKLVSVTAKDAEGNDVNASDTGVVFNNIYQSADAVIKVRKTLDGRSMREGETFAFELREKGSDEVLQTLLIKGEAGLSEKEGTFQPITFKKTGTHEYIVTEVKGNDSDIAYDETDHDVTVTIGEDEDRQLTASVKYDNSETDQALNITNVWKASVEWAPSVMKETLGGSPEGYNFEMNLTAGPEGGAELPENCTATSDAAGKIAFDKIRFTKPGTYTVTVHETKGTDDKIEYDGHTVKYQLEVTASDADSKLSVTESVDDATTFTNDAGLRISKTIVAGTGVTLTQDDYDKLFEFTLSLKDQDHNTLKGPFATTIREADGTVVKEFKVGDGSTFELSHNQTAYVYGLPSGTLYQVKETPEDGWFSVESLVNSGSTGPGAYQTPSFTNVKMSADTQLILGYKALTGTDGMNRPGLGLDSFTFKIEPVKAEVEEVPETDADDEQTKPAQETVPDSDEEEQPAKEEGELAAEPEQPAEPASESNVQQVALPKIISQKTTLRPGDPDFPMPAQTEVSSSATGVIDFGEIKYTQAGTYQYKITEINKTDPEITYSQAEWTVTVTVENIVTSGNVTGVKVTDVKYESNGQTADAFTFINEFVGTPALNLHKSLSINGGPETDVEEAQPVKAGDHVTYYLTASVPEDKATAAAKNVVITDVIPTMNEDGDQEADLVLLNKGTASAYDETSRKLTWNVGDIAVGESVTVSWSVQVPEVKKATSWTNIAAATYSNNPNNPEEIPSNEVTVETEPARPDVTIHKAQLVNKPGSTDIEGFSDDGKAVMTDQGSLVIYELTVTNKGDAPAKNVVVTDKIPVADNGVSLEFGKVFDEGSYDAGKQTVSWTLPELAANATVRLHFSVKIPTGAAYNSWTNQATVRHQDPEDPDKETPEKPSNEVTVETDVPALKIEKDQKLNEDADFTTDDLHGRDGDIVTYHVKVTNTSAVEAKDVVLKDVIPAGTPENPLKLVDGSIGSGGNAFADGSIVWNLGAVPAGESREVTFQVRIPYVKELTIWLNVASVTFSNNPAGPDEPLKSNEVKVDAKAPKLSLEKFQNFDGEQPVKTLLTSQGKEEIVTYTLRAVNTGEFTAENVVITDEVPANTTLLEDSISDNGKVRNGVIEWNVGDIAPGQANAKTVSFQVKLSPVTGHMTWKNAAAAVYDNNPENPTDPKDPKTPVPSNEVEIEADGPEVSIVKSQQKNEEEPATPILVDQDDLITYSLTVSNTGKDAALDVVVKDPVPEGLELDETSISDGGMAKDGVITWNLGTLEAGADKTVTFQVKVPEVKEATVWKNAASTTYSNRENPEDPIPSNEVEAKSDVPHLVIEKEQQRGEEEKTKDLMEVAGEDIVTYYVTVTNDGSAEAQDVLVKDTVPEGLSLVKDSISDGGTEKDGLITWSLGNLGAGEKRTVSFQVTVPDEKGIWRNIAYTSYPNNPDNEEGEDPKDTPSNEVIIVEMPDEEPRLLLDKTQALNGGAFTKDILTGKAQDVVTYALTVRNAGKTAAEGITVSDVVPEGLKYVKGSASHEAIYESGKLTWYLESLEAGESITLQFKAKLPADNAAGSWKNVAKLTYQNDPEGPEHETPSNEVEVKKTPKTPVTSTNGKPHPGSAANTAAGTGLFGWSLLAAGAGLSAAGLGVNARRRRKAASGKRK